MKKYSQIIVIAILFLLYWLVQQGHISLPKEDSTPSASNQIELLEKYYNNKVSKKMIKISGVVVKLLADDNIKPRHQKFIIQVNNEFSLLVTHNIDLAPRINSLQTRDEVEIYGQYEWNHKGGILHWTHHDPKKRRQGGWIIHRGKKYE